MSQLKINDGNGNWIPIPAGGVGVPSGGTQGQAILKTGSNDYQTGWRNIATSVNGQTGAVTVKEAASATVFQLGAGASTVTSFSTGIYDPNNSTVRIYLVARSTSDIGFTTILATVPEAYRPSAVVTLFGFFSVNSAPIAYTGRLFTNGVILQDLSASAREVFLCGEYVI